MLSKTQVLHLKVPYVIRRSRHIKGNHGSKVLQRNAFDCMIFYAFLCRILNPEAKPLIKDICTTYEGAMTWGR